MIRHSKGKVKIEESAQDKETTHKMKELMQEFLKFRHNFASSSKSMEELLGYSLKLTSIGLDCPTVFNFRKDLLSKYFESLRDASKESSDEDKTAAFGKIKDLVETEIKYLTKMAMEDPKSYEIWFHRAWIIKTFSSQEAFYANSYKVTRFLIEMDLSICEKYLKKDERNFHAWNYRLELNKILFELFPNDLQSITDKELDFIRSKLDENFSNYSAIHFFTKFIKMKTDLIAENFKFFIDREVLIPQLETNLEAIMISPNEQALWLYQRWLIENLTDVKIVHAHLSENRTEVELLLNRALPESLVEKLLKITIDGEVILNSTIQITKIGTSSFRLKQVSHKSFSNCSLELNNPKLKNELQIAEGNITYLQANQPSLNKDLLENILTNFEELEVPSLETRMFKLLNIYFIRRNLILEQWYGDKIALQSHLAALQKEFVAKADQEKYKTPFFQRIIEKQRGCSGDDLEEILACTHLI